MSRHIGQIFRSLACLTLFCTVQPASFAQPASNVSASAGIAIGGNVANSTLTIGLTPKDAQALVAAEATRWRTLTDKQRADLQRTERELGVTEAALRAFFAILGEKEVPPDQLPARLVAIATQVLQTKNSIGAASSDTDQIAQLKANARTALDQGRLTEADDLLTQIGTLQEASLGSQMKARADTAMQRATLAMSRFHYKDAADQLALAQNFAPDDASRSRYARSQIKALLEQAVEFDDDAAYAQAMRLLRSRVALIEEVEDPEGWANAERDLGVALTYRGIDKTPKADVDEALQALSRAQTSKFAVSNPTFHDWSAGEFGLALCNVGIARSDTAMRQRGSAMLVEAETGYRTRQDFFTAAMIAINLSSCLTQSDPSAQGVVAAATFARDYFHKRLKVLQQDGSQPTQWAETNISAASVEMMLAERLPSPEALAEVVQHMHSALTVLTAENSPTSWSHALRMLAFALRRLAKYQIDVSPLEEAIQVADVIVSSERAKPFRDRAADEFASFEFRIYLGYRNEDRELIRSAITTLQQVGYAPDRLDVDLRSGFETQLAEARRYLADPASSPPSDSQVTPLPKSPTYALDQLSIDLGHLASAEVDRTKSSFLIATAAIHSCRESADVAKKIGAKLDSNGSILASDLPPPLQTVLISTKVGMATPAFGDANNLRVLVLCGRAKPVS